MYKFLIRPILFCFSPENIHNFVFFILKMASKIPYISNFLKFFFHIKDKKLEKEIMGIKFPNPVGLAAGLDKDAEAFDILSHLGFGFIEIGTLTPKAQDGNQKPRCFRLKNDKALINRMGFNNLGIEKAIKNLKNKKSNLIVGGNIGKNKVTKNEDAIKDYIFSFEKLFDFVDYFVINISSPNTPNLRKLQSKEPLENLLSEIQKRNLKKSKPKPILLKISPDLSFPEIDDIIEIIFHTKIDGIVATNTTISRENLSYSKEKINNFGNGGLSGKPLKDRSTEIIRYIAKKSKKKFVIIGVGGIMTEKDAIEKLEAGADLIQIYTGFIYEGVNLIKKINKKILFLNKND